MEYEDLVIYGNVFYYEDIPKNCPAYKIFLDSGHIIDERNDFIDFYIGDFFGDFYFGYHEPTKKCFLSLGEIYSETTLHMVDQNKIGNKKIIAQLDKWMAFFGQFNNDANWHFLSV